VDDSHKKAFSGMLSRPTDIGNEPGHVVIPQELPVLTLRNTVLYPGSIVPLGIGRPKTVRLVEESIRDNGLVAVVAQRDPDCDDPGAKDLYDVGCAASLVKLVKTGKDNFSVVVRGLARVKLTEYTQSLPYLRARVQSVEEPNIAPVEVEALAMSLKKAAREVLKLIPELPPSAAELLEKVEDPSVLADLISSNVEASIEEKQQVLETAELTARMRKVLELLTRQLEVLKLSNKISSQVKGEMSKTQREYYLRQQLKAIKDELGDTDESDDDLADLERRIQLAHMSEEAEKAARKELKRLRNMSSSQAEYTVARTYLEWLCDLPWKTETEDKLILDDVRRILNEDHYGLEKVKKRIVEYLAVRKLKSDLKGPILCLAGPPGVGKTSLGQSIAKAMGRKFVRVAMGGVRDEAEIRGHRRTYVGALPGRIVQGMKKSGSKNPVFVLDEVDKLAHDFRGDPAAALLEVLDPEQNHTFGDHYLDVPFDLSKSFFIATANQLDTIPAPLRDRMEIIEIPGYTREEKMQIARTHMLPKQLENHGITAEQMQVTDKALEKLVGSYTREAGVRNLNREVAAMCRSIAVEIADGKVGPFTVDEAKLEEVLGPEKYISEMAERTELPGVATGLAWTAVGGDILFIEANRMRGKGSMQLTGQLGDVMKESAQAALSYIRSQAAKLGIDDSLFASWDLHLHVPAGGIPKDGPSAGVTMLTALVSLLTGIRVRNDVAMTGEITLRGNVLPVGGIKEKVLAAKRAGVTKIILPERNKKDLADIPAHNLKGLEFTFAHRMDDVLLAALERMPTPIPEKPINQAVAVN
jgi:ATP-dependent Lon protease